MTQQLDYWTARALLDWQIEMGVDEAMLDAPLDRTTLTDAAPPRPAAPRSAPAAPDMPAGEAARSAPQQAQPAPPRDGPDPVEAARAAAQGAGDLAALEAALDGFTLCPLRRGARATIFGQGSPAARVMLIADPPGAEEERTGAVFAGPAAGLMDRMLAAIGLSFDAEDAAQAAYAAAILPWRPPGDRPPEPGDLAMLRPFLERQVALVDPAVIVPMGAACHALLGGSALRLRGTWAEALGRPALPMLPPARLLDNPSGKRDAWADLLALKARLAP